MSLCIFNVYLFVGTLMGITNTLATLPGIFGPYIVGVITYRNVSAVLAFAFSLMCNFFLQEALLLQRDRATRYVS